jgi:hypothetical protein
MRPVGDDSASAHASACGVKPAPAGGGRSIGAGTSEIRRRLIGRERFNQTK